MQYKHGFINEDVAEILLECMRSSGLLHSRALAPFLDTEASRLSRVHLVCFLTVPLDQELSFLT